MYNYKQLYKLSKTELVNLVIRESGTGLIRGPEDAHKFFADFAGLVKDWQKEHFIVLCVNTKNYVIHSELVSLGHLTASLVHPREVFKNVLSVKGTAGIIIGHNHPSGDPEPSLNDREITEMIFKAGKLLGIPLLDSIVFTKLGKYYSFSEKGRLQDDNQL